MNTDAARVMEFGRPVEFGGQVHLRETARGAWVVRDEANSRGGHFRDRKAALRFVRREFGHSAHIIERRQPVTPKARRLSSGDQIRLLRERPSSASKAA